MLENEAEKKGIVFETVIVKGNFVEKVIETVNKYGVDALLLDDTGKKIDEIKENISCAIVRPS